MDTDTRTFTGEDGGGDEPPLKLRIDGADYPFPSFDTLSYREARRIKKETGLVMGQFFTALEQGDPDALLAVALIAKLRDNPAYKVEDLYDLTLDEIEIVTPPTKPVEDVTTPLESGSDGSDDKTNDESPPSEGKPSAS